MKEKMESKKGVIYHFTIARQSIEKAVARWFHIIAFNVKNEAASFFNEESRTDKETEYAVVTYTDIKEWLEEVVNKDTKDAKFNSIVKDYLSIVKILLNEKEDIGKINQDDYEYTEITVTDENGYGWDYPIDYLMKNAVSHLSKEEQIEYLNDIIRDIEHYRDTL